VGRRDLERRFRHFLNRSVLEEIHKARTELAANLLGDTQLSIAVVARQVGFTSTRQLDEIFAQHMGMTPSAFRRQAQARRDPELRAEEP